MQKIRLHGDLKNALGDRDDLFLIEDGIATKEQYDDFQPGVAHCYPEQNGRPVKRYGKVIGTVDDIEVIAVH
jgi:hypothetical protein